MAEIRLENVVKEFGGGEQAVKDISVTIKDGSFTILVGPSGCGKSTTLRMIAGLESQTSGNIWIDDKNVNNVPASKRDVAMVFQNYALYPTMTVRENIEFGLINRKVPKEERKKLIDEVVDIVDLRKHLDKKPDKLSGGQRQRVALARAMVKKPKLFILDEPLSNLDAKLRTQMRAELIQLHKRLGTTFVYVTHDQIEAMSMGTDIIIMDHGVVKQQGSPMEVYENPTNTFSASFIGTPPMNIIDRSNAVNVLQDINDTIQKVGIRPEHIHISTKPLNLAHCIELSATILSMETLGAETLYQVKTDMGVMNVRSFLTPLSNVEEYFISIPYEKLFAFDRNGDTIKAIVFDIKEEPVHVFN
ncbi:Carbohydrate ABC transporter ATP-binding protein (CUT1 family) OS=Ureibacillus acetophenoni OX=614649 GN=SAMN05877842_10336 PE=4 SV=1 [Ureibacillus acetophenoni]